MESGVTVPSMTVDTTPIERAGSRSGALLSCADAAALLDVAPAALTTWSRRLAFPADVGGAEAPRFRRAEIEALRDALAEAHSVVGAVRAARRQVAGRA